MVRSPYMSFLHKPFVLFPYPSKYALRNIYYALLNAFFHAALGHDIWHFPQSSSHPMNSSFLKQPRFSFYTPTAPIFSATSFVALNSATLLLTSSTILLFSMSTPSFSG